MEKGFLSKGIIVFLLITNTLHNIAQEQKVFSKATKGFVENKGQVYDQNYKPNPSVKYLFTGNNGLNVQLKSTGFSYDTYRAEPQKNATSQYLNSDKVDGKNGSSKQSTYYFHRIDVELVGANSNSNIIAEDPSLDFINYYTTGTTPDEGFLNLYKYKKVTYQEIYPGIDLEFLVHQEGDKTVEYNFIVKENGDINQIKLRYSGQLGQSFAKDKIKIHTSNGTMYEMIPASWIRETAEPQNVEYKIIEQTDNYLTVGLATRTPQKKGETLIIDPAPILEWGSYFGGTWDEWLVKMSISLTNDVYAAGNSISTSLATSGVYQTVMNGSYDAILVKFNESGARQWCTYFGGSGIDGAHSVSVDIIPGTGVNIIGRAVSTGLASIGSYEDTKPGGAAEFATFIARFNNTNGTLLWSTYYGYVDGGEQNLLEHSSPSITNSFDAIYVASSSNADPKIPFGASIQPTCNGWNDIAIAKFDFSGNIVWGTYYGSGDRETGSAICLDLAENVYISGGVKTTGLSTAGAFQASLSGGYDAFLMKVDKNGVKKWFTYYGGPSYDYGNALSYSPVIDAIYFGGTTSSDVNIASAGSFIPTRPGAAGKASGFLSCFSSAGNRLWGTYIGGIDDEGVLGVTTACNGEALVVLESKSPGLSTTNVYQSTITGSSDALIVRFNPAGVRQWATYYGGSDRERCSDIKINTNNRIYVCGHTSSTTLISTPNGFQPTYAGGWQEGFIARFSETNIAGTKTVCKNSTLTLTAEISTTATPISYNWSGPAGASGTGSTLSVTNMDSTKAGVYTLTVTQGGCTYIKTDTVKVSPIPTPTASVISPICINDSIKLSSTGGVSYSWSGPNSFASTLQNPIIPTSILANSGVYTVTATNSYGCTATAQATLVVNPRPATSASSNSPICEYETINLTSLPNSQNSYSWSGPLTYTANTQNPTIANAAIGRGGIYTVTITNSFGCTSSAQTTVVVNPNPTASASSNSPICEYRSIKLSSTPNGMTSYLWSGPLTFTSTKQNDSITNALVTSSGVYSVIVTNSFGCKDTAFTTVTVNPNPIATATSNSPVCETKTLNLSSGPNSQTSYLWSGPLTYTSSSQNPSITNTILTQSGVYSVIVTNTYGCKDTANVSVVINPNPIVGASSNSPICEGDTLKLSSTGGISWEWTNSTTYSSTNQNPVIVSSLPSMSDTYTVVATNGFGCTASAQTPVIVNVKPIATISSSPAVCSGYTLNLYSSGGSDYLWDGPNGFASTLQNPIIDPVSYADSGLFTVIVTNAFTCKDTASLNVIVHDNPTPTISSNSPLCAYDSIQLQAGGGVSYSWNGVSSYTSSVQSPVIHTNNTSLAGLYTVVVTDQFGCTASISTTVDVKDNPKPTLSSNSPVCEGDTLKLFSSAGQSYLWNGPLGWTQSVQNAVQSNISTSYNGYYKQVITYSNGCINDDSLLFVVHPKPIITLNSDTIICQHQGINISASGALTYLWNNGVSVSNYQIYPSADTTYEVYATDLNGCRDTASFDVTVLPFIELSIVQSPAGTLFTKQIATFNVIPSGYSNYSFYVNNQIVQNSSDNTFTASNFNDKDELSVIISNPNMCFNVLKVPIHVIDIYNSFSPNDDGVNDLFMRGYQITIFNRWGDIMYQGIEGWNGKKDGEDVNTGTYYFTIKYFSAEGQEINYKGDLMLVR